MQHVLKIARGLSSPAILIVAVWCAALVGVAVGPIEYPQQPSVPVLLFVATGISLFVSAYQAGVSSFRVWLRNRPNFPAPPLRMLNITVTVSSLVGLAGIALIALDRIVLSGLSNGDYAELLRCAPDLADVIEIKRTPLLYLGYLTFSFGFASLVLFLLRGEEIRGLPAILAQLSILSPIGYALLYSGRMPILFAILLVIAAMLVRIGQGRPPFARGHHLLVKMIAFFLLFAIYSNAMWSSRQGFCVRMTQVIRELQDRVKERKTAHESIVQQEQEQSSQEPLASVRHPTQTDIQPRSVDSISAVDLMKMIDETRELQGADKHGPSTDAAALLATLQEAWHVRPRQYVLSALESGRLSPAATTNALSNYFYLTHGIRIVDVAWHARSQLSPLWGIYEIGVLSPILRVFFPQNHLLSSMHAQLKASEIEGFFPTVWAAAFIDFGFSGAVVYILIWGFAAGWSSSGARHSVLNTPALLLTFILASIMLSPIQGPLGIANSALVMISMLIVGLAIDFGSRSAGSGQPFSVAGEVSAS
jgi:hypothetical protein